MNMQVIRRHKILFVFNNVLGHQTYAEQLMRVLARRNDIDYQVLRFRAPALSRMLLKRHNVTTLGRVIRWIDPISAYESVVGRYIRREVRRYCPDLIHFAPQWPAGAVSFSEPPVAFTAALDCTRANMESAFQKGAWTEADIRSEERLFARAARLYPWSTWAARSLVGDYHVPEDRIRLILPSTDLTKIPRALHQGGNKPKIIFIGNDFYRKGGDRLHRWVTGPLAGLCELHIVSGDRRAPGSSQYVHSHGRVPNEQLVKELLPKMDLLCHPTRSDMSAYVVVEASAAGLPSIASAIGGIPDLISHETSGLLVPRDDELGFVSALRRLLASNELRQQMGNAAYQIAAERFSADRNFDLLINELKLIAEELRSYSGPTGISSVYRLRA
jgi:glycosyltransferase involved in cell wall biosynthesis